MSCFNVNKQINEMYLGVRKWLPPTDQFINIYSTPENDAA